MKNTNGKVVEWRIYERVCAVYKSENVGIDFTIIPNASIEGRLSKIKRQIDVLIDARWGEDFSRRIIVDAKLYGRKIHIKDVETFEGMMRDVNAHRGIIICPKGWSEGAKRRAQDAITIELLSLEDFLNNDYWGDFDQCIGECKKNPVKHSNKGVVIWDADHPIILNGAISVVFTGKCDVCHNFHVWCSACGEKFALDVEDNHKCDCGWLWSSVIEEEIEGLDEGSLKAVHLLLLANDKLIPLDRRMLK